MFELFVVPVLTGHLLAMNLASAGPLVCIWLRIHKRSITFRFDQTDLLDRMGQRLAWWSTWALLLGMALGGILLLPENGPLWDALGRFPAKTYWNGAGELVFSFACLLGFAATWRRLRERPILHGLLGLLSVANLLYHFPPLMIVLGKITADAGWTSEPIIARKLFLQLMLRGEVLSLSIHYIMASCIVSAVVLLWLVVAQSAGEQRHANPPLADIASKGANSMRRAEAGRGREAAAPERLSAGEASRRLASRAALFATVSVALQIPIGVWTLAMQPVQLRYALMGNNVTASLCFAGGLMASLALLQMLIATIQGEFHRNRILRIVVTTALVSLLMVLSLRTG
jgi:hypothetical protein